MSHFDRQQDAFWDVHTNQRSYDHPVVQSFARQRVQVVRQLLGSANISSALDVGCGDGFGMMYMQQLAGTIYGCDRSQAMLQINPTQTRNLSRVDAYDLPFPDTSFDLVYCWELLHHLENPIRALQEMARVSRNYVLIFEPNPLNPAMALFGMLASAERGLLRFVPWNLKRFLAAANLQPIQMFTGGYFTPNRVPQWWADFVQGFSYACPLIGVSNVALARVQRDS